MIYGIGTGLVSVQTALDAPDGLFTAAEKALIASRPDQAQARAGRLAGKRAAACALRLTWPGAEAEIEILEDASGVPTAAMRGAAAEKAAAAGVTRLELSLSGEGDCAFASAFAIMD